MEVQYYLRSLVIMSLELQSCDENFAVADCSIERNEFDFVN
jgi:hypothetical protein